MALTVEENTQLTRFKAQYLQLLDLRSLSLPDRATLKKADVQAWLFKNLFDKQNLQHLPNDRYQARVLKIILARVEESIEDPDQDEILDDLMSSLSSILANRVPNEADEAQRKSYVTYTFPVPPSIVEFHACSSVTTLESRAIISSSGTTGLRTWEAALHLGSYLSSRGLDHIRNKHVLELGAGTGVLSILCAKYLKARQVAATDGNEGIVDALRENIFVNGLEGDSRIESLVLRWASSLSETSFVDESAFDVVLGADVTYDENAIGPLVSTLSELLALNANTNVLIAATIRNHDTFACFLMVCRYNGLSTSEIDFGPPTPEAQTGPFYSTNAPIRIVRVTQRGESKDPFSM